MLKADLKKELPDFELLTMYAQGFLTSLGEDLREKLIDICHENLVKRTNNPHMCFPGRVVIKANALYGCTMDFLGELYGVSCRETVEERINDGTIVSNVFEAAGCTNWVCNGCPRANLGYLESLILVGNSLKMKEEQK